LAKLWQKIQWHLFSGHGVVSTDLDYSELSVSADIECIFLKIKTHNGYVNVANVYLPGTLKARV